MNGRLLLAAGNLIALLATIAVNYLSNAIPFSGQTAGDIAAKFDVIFKPAGYAFTIWGLIYLSLLIFAIYQILPAQRQSGLSEKIGPFFILSCIANASWLYFWHQERFFLTVILMLVLLFSLIAIYLRLGIGAQPVGAVERWFVHLPFSLYLGWISVATIANLTIFLASIDWSGFGLSPSFWFGVVLLAGLLLSFSMSWQRHDLAYGLVIVWAFVAVAVQNSGVPSASLLSWLAAALSVIVLIAGHLLNRRAIV